VAALEVSIACGLIIGGVVISRMVLRGDKNGYMFWSFVVMAAMYVGIYFSPSFWLSVGLLGIGGIANVGVFVPSITMFQEVKADGDRGRLIAVRAAFGQMGATGGLLLGGVVGEVLGVVQAFLVAGIAAVGMSLLIYVPHAIGASRRSRVAWSTAMESGSTRALARKAAKEAALAGPHGAWALAAENAALEQEA
jgi:MFS family permease